MFFQNSEIPTKNKFEVGILCQNTKLLQTLKKRMTNVDIEENRRLGMVLKGGFDRMTDAKQRAQDSLGI